MALFTAARRRPAMLNAIRCISSKIFVGRLTQGIDDHMLKVAFSRFGKVAEARVVMDVDTGKPIGNAYVTFVDDASATPAIAAMDGKKLHGRRLVVCSAHDVDYDGDYDYFDSDDEDYVINWLR